MKKAKKPSRVIFLLFLGFIFAALVATSRVSSQTQTFVRLNPEFQEVPIGETATVTVDIEGVEDLYGFDISLSYDSSLVTLANDQVQIDNFLGSSTLLIGPNIDQAQGSFQMAVMKTGQVPGSSGSGTLFTLRFQATNSGVSPLILNPVILLNSQGGAINHQLENSQIIVAQLTPTSSPSPSPTLTPPSPTPISSSTPTSSPTPNPTIGPQASFQLSPSEETYFLGDTPTVDLYLDSWGNSVLGATAVLQFDPSRWEVKEIIKGSIFPNYPQNFFDNINGLIKVSGTANYKEYFSDRGVFAQIVFTTKQEGETMLKFDFIPGSTTDSDIVSALDGSELLTEAPLTGHYSLIFAPVLNFRYNLPHRLQEVGNQAKVQLSTDDQTFTAVVEADRNGIYEGLSLKQLILNQAYRFIIKIQGFLKKRAKQEIVLYGGNNPKEAYLDFGDLDAGDLNDDNIVNNLDLAELFDSWDTQGMADFNGDSVTNNFDVWILFANFFKEAQL